ncbi:hypothetical protein SAMN04488122_1184 [Chitinophaga arvensicola]|uniref:Uncharacterized protein n=1 Tax=Chitinophaga arvensicola TaxID=29529 RepID=A0A1I0Q2U6_9BACT|nr:hypothetical protein SAMN04488122_1184 [Chitinophaga arvensicola]
MHNNPTGSMLSVCKKYTETASIIRWHSTGEVFLHSRKSIIINGKQEGVKFHKHK